MANESLVYDVIIVGAGPAGLSAAIHLKQLAAEKQRTIQVAVFEKGQEVGAHIISGAILETKLLAELLPDWKSLNPPTHTPVRKDQLWLLSKNYALSLPILPMLKNEGNLIISLSQWCKWLARKAENLGVDIFSGFAGRELLFDAQDRVIGIRTNADLDKNSQVDVIANQVLLAEGCHGFLSQQVIKHYELLSRNTPRSYALGVKEVWRLAPKWHQAGLALHTTGWPLASQNYGGGFIYHWGDNLASLGLIVDLNYTNPHLDPHAELQRLKLHPKIKPMFAGAQLLEYGARSLNTSGWQALPKLSFPGGLLLGCAAGMINAGKLKGIHNAMASGMLAAKEVAANLDTLSPGSELINFTAKIKGSEIGRELFNNRNIRPAFNYGQIPGLLHAAADNLLFRNRAPWTLALKPKVNLLSAQAAKPICYPQPDGEISFEKLTSVYYANTQHPENSPAHIELKSPSLALSINYRIYNSPESKYCPAKVYEIIKTANDELMLKINHSNCLHCQACVIKDPTQNILWQPPLKGGPNYRWM